jgi:hypothetical protein
MIEKLVLGTLPALVLLAVAPTAFAQSSTMSTPMNNEASPTMSAAPMASMSTSTMTEVTPFRHKSYVTEKAAAAACKTPVVWVYTGAGPRTYYPSSSNLFGKAKPGVYGCLRDALKSHYQPSAN